jgi:hypothetical protein
VNKRMNRSPGICQSTDCPHTHAREAIAGWHGCQAGHATAFKRHHAIATHVKLCMLAPPVRKTHDRRPLAFVMLDIHLSNPIFVPVHIDAL